MFFFKILFAGFSQDSNLGPLNSGQMLLPTEPLDIGEEDRWHLSIDTARVSGWISLRLGKLSMNEYIEVLCAATR